MNSTAPPPASRIGLTWNLPLDGGGLVVSNQIGIEIGPEAVVSPERRPAMIIRCLSS